MRRHLPILLLTAACHGTGASATFNGTVRGQSMTPSASISAPATVSFASGMAPVAAILLSDASALCTLFGLNEQAKSSRSLLLFLADVNASTGAIEVPPGTASFSVFAVGSGAPPAHFAVASFGVDDASCQRIPSQSATAVSGTILLTGNSGGAYQGTYDLTFDSGDHVTGSFDTAVCHAVTTFLASDLHSCG